jgi:cystathionine beta-synthase
VVGVEPVDSTYFGALGPCRQSGAGKPRGASTPATFDAGQIDVPWRVSDAEAFTTARFLARALGLLVGGSAGGVVLAALRTIQEAQDSRDVSAEVLVGSLWASCLMAARSTSTQFTRLVGWSNTS